MSAGTAERRDGAAFASFKIAPRHPERLAIVYVQQSHPAQVLHHPESAHLQYSLTEHAVALGWPLEVRVADTQPAGRAGAQPCVERERQRRPLLGLTRGLDEPDLSALICRSQ
ncbi:hypothetical protein [Sorangium cellulosum]|uniref:hypothetical protein n=1 Tax=Sorangium cellulosum TaxID=56 RepID=UPI0005D1D27F|nr:hypothetical protein [Sorangium cellulosum]